MVSNGHYFAAGNMSEPPKALRKAIRDFFARVATAPGGELSFHSGRLLANLLGYPPPLLERLPEEALESFVGVGNPLQLGPIGPGQYLLDIGCGSGLDCLVAAQLVGPHGRVVGVDLTPEMVRKACTVAHRLGIGQVAFLEGDAEYLPLKPGSMDIVISNAAILFCADKPRVFAQAYQTLKPGGRLFLADVLIPDDMATGLEVLELLGQGFQLETEYLAMLEAAGFTEVELVSWFDAAAGVLGELDWPDSPGIMGASVRAHKPPHDPQGNADLCVAC